MEIQGWSHSQKPDLPPTLFAPCNTGLYVLLLLILPLCSSMTVQPLAMAPSPQQTFSGQGVLRISGFLICCCFSVIVFVLVLFFIVFLIQLAGDIELNPGPQRQLKSCRILYANIRGLYKNLKDLTIASVNQDIIFCSETLVSNYRNSSELLIPNFNKPFLIKRVALPRARGMCVYIRSGYSAQHLTRFSCHCHEMQLVRVSSKHHNHYVFGLYRNPDANNELYDCLLTAMASIQSVDIKASFIFVGDLNAHHQEWLGSISPTNRNGLAALDFSNLSGCEQLIRGPTHNSGNCLDIVLTNMPGVVEASVLAPIGTSDHNAIHCKICLEFTIPDITISRQVYLKSRVNWDNVCMDVDRIHWNTIFKSNDPVLALNTCLLEILHRRVPSKIIKSRIKDKAWFDNDCRRAYDDKQAAYHLWRRNRSQLLWDNYVALRVEAQRIYNAAETAYNSHLQDVLAGATQPHRWWSSLKSSLFGVDSSMPPLLEPDGSMSFEPLRKATLLSNTFISKQRDQELMLPLTCFPSPKLNSVAFKSTELKNYLLDLDSYGGTDPDGFFPLFFKKIATILAPKLAVVFRLLLKSGSFPSCWRKANITPIPKGASASTLPSEYRPISITPILSKIFERLLAKRLIQYCDSIGAIPDTQFGFRKGLGTCDALLTLTHDLQSSLDCRHESRIVAIDFSSAFDIVNHKALIYKLQLLGIGGSLLNIFRNFLTNRSQRVSLDGVYSASVPVVSGVPQGSVLGPLFFIIFTSDLGIGLENNLISYADDTTLYSSVRSPCNRGEVAESLNRDLAKIASWCQLWGMKLNSNKTHSITISRSRILNPLHPCLYILGEPIEEVDNLRLLGVILDSKLTFEKHIRSLSSSIAQKTGLLRKCYRTFACDSTVIKSFFAFILPHFEYCAPVWMSAANCHLKLLDRALNSIKFISPALSVDLDHRRMVGALSMFFKVFNTVQHPLHAALPDSFNPVRMTRFALNLNDLAVNFMNVSTTQFSRCFIPALIKTWNVLPNDIVQSRDITLFKSRVNVFLKQ